MRIVFRHPASIPAAALRAVTVAVAMFCLLGVAAVAPGAPAARAASRAEDQPRAVTAQAAHPAPEDYTVTLVARQCATYEQIMANRAD